MIAAAPKRISQAMRQQLGKVEGQVSTEDIHSDEDEDKDKGPVGDERCEKAVIYSDEGASGSLCEQRAIVLGEKEGCSVSLALEYDPQLLKLGSHTHC
jgi:hypothetical protein